MQGHGRTQEVIMRGGPWNGQEEKWLDWKKSDAWKIEWSLDSGDKDIEVS